MKGFRSRKCAPAALALLALLGSVIDAAEPVRGPTVRNAWARATPPGAAAAAVYLTIVGGTTADRLLGASTVRAGTTELHVVSHEGGMARMRPSGGVDIAPKVTVVLAPEGLHFMLMELPRPLVEGETFEMRLKFARGGSIPVPVQVVAPGASGLPPH